MISEVVEFEDLQRLSGFNRRGDVERWAERAGVPVKPCRGGVWTTLTALNQALGVVPAVESSGGYGPEVV